MGAVGACRRMLRMVLKPPLHSSNGGLRRNFTKPQPRHVWWNFDAPRGGSPWISKRGRQVLGGQARFLRNGSMWGGTTGQEVMPLMLNINLGAIEY